MTMVIYNAYHIVDKIMHIKYCYMMISNTQHMKEITSGTADKPWRETIQAISVYPRKTAVALFRLTTGHDLLAKHLFRLGIMQTPSCTLSNYNTDMDRHHLTTCPGLQTHTKVER